MKKETNVLPIRVGTLENRIYAGKLKKNEKEFRVGKVDVTADVLRSIVEFIGAGHSLVISVNDIPKYSIAVTEVKE